jgi:transcriptional regulator GlxA family with amidase domain
MPRVQADYSDRPLAQSSGQADANTNANALQDPALLRRLLRAKDRMDAASHEVWPVKRLAEVSGVSEAHFAGSFKQAFGVPPHRYLLTRRIEQATTLLRDTGLRITEIALATGWESLGTFGRTFQTSLDAAPAPCALRPAPTCLALTACPPVSGRPRSART